MALTKKEVERIAELEAEIQALRQEKAVELLPKYQDELKDAERRIALHTTRLEKAEADQKLALQKIGEAEMYLPDPKQTEVFDD